MTIWQLYHNFFFSIFEPFFSIQASFLCVGFLFFFCIFFLKTSVDLAFFTSNLVLLINSHHCFRQQKNAAKIPKNRQKPRRRTENTVRFQQLEGKGGWKGSAGEVWGGRGRPFLGSHILRTYLQQKGLGEGLVLFGDGGSKGGQSGRF